MPLEFTCLECNKIMNHIDTGECSGNTLVQCPECKIVKGIDGEVFCLDPRWGLENKTEDEIRNYLRDIGLSVEIKKLERDKKRIRF